VFDWFTQESSTLLSAYWTDVGLACNCHTHFGEYCVLELGLGIEDKGIHEHKTLKNVYAGSGKHAFYIEENTEYFPNRFEEPVEY